MQICKNKDNLLIKYSAHKTNYFQNKENQIREGNTPTLIVHNNFELSLWNSELYSDLWIFVHVKFISKNVWCRVCRMELLEI